MSFRQLVTSVTPILGYGWMPDLGYSQHEDFLYQTERAALRASIKETEEFMATMAIKLASLKDQATRCTDS